MRYVEGEAKSLLNYTDWMKQPSDWCVHIFSGDCLRHNIVDQAWHVELCSEPTKRRTQQDQERLMDIFLLLPFMVCHSNNITVMELPFKCVHPLNLCIMFQNRGVLNPISVTHGWSTKDLDIALSLSARNVQWKLGGRAQWHLTRDISRNQKRWITRLKLWNDSRTFLTKSLRQQHDDVSCPQCQTH